MTNQDRQSFATAAYLRVKALWRGQTSRGRIRRGEPGAQGSTPFSGGRDPRPLGDVLFAASQDMGWGVEMEQARLISDWPAFVGETVAPHTTVVELRDGTLIVQCDSVAWTTELRRLRGEILTRIAREYPDADVQELKFLAPGAPSWRYGPRSVPGRGPRDTYS